MKPRIWPGSPGFKWDVNQFKKDKHYIIMSCVSGFQVACTVAENIAQLSMDFFLKTNKTVFAVISKWTKIKIYFAKRHCKPEIQTRTKRRWRVSHSTDWPGVRTARRSCERVTDGEFQTRRVVPEEVSWLIAIPWNVNIQHSIVYKRGCMTFEWLKNVQNIVIVEKITY